jgi:hypothetical protein
VRYRRVGDDGVLVHLDSGRVIAVNEAGLYIVEQLSQGAQSRAALIAGLTARFETDAEQAGTDLDRYLEALSQEQVLDTGTSPAPG